MWLGATSARPAVELLLAPGAERIPLPLPDDVGAFDHGLERAGWLAVHVQYRLIALADGDWLRPRPIAQAWGIAPAADPRHVLIRPYGGDERRIDLLDAEGRVLRSVATEDRGVVGELAGGPLVLGDGGLTWEGDPVELPFAGEAIAVLGGRHIVSLDGKTLSVGRASVTLPGEPWLLSPAFDAAAERIAFRRWNEPHVVVATEDGLRILDVGFMQQATVWLADGRLLLVGDREHLVLDVDSGERSSIEGFPRRALPRVDATGRFDPEALRAAQRPAFTGPMGAEAREAAFAALEPVPGMVRGVGLRSCLPPKRMAIGASRLGGRPDLPRGFAWPTHAGEPMAFLAQLRGDELAAILPDLKDEGLLVVFAAIEADSGAPDAVSLAFVAGPLTRRAWPASLPLELRYGVALAALEPRFTPPGELLRIASDPLMGSTFGDGGTLVITVPSDLSEARIDLETT